MGEVMSTLTARRSNMIALATLDKGVVFIGPGTRLVVEESADWADVWVIAIYTHQNPDMPYTNIYYANEYDSQEEAMVALNELLKLMGDAVSVL